MYVVYQNKPWARKAQDWYPETPKRVKRETARALNIFFEDLIDVTYNRYRWKYWRKVFAQQWDCMSQLKKRTQLYLLVIIKRVKPYLLTSSETKSQT